MKTVRQHAQQFYSFNASNDVWKTQPGLKILLKTLRVGTELAQVLVIEQESPQKSLKPLHNNKQNDFTKNQPISHLSSSLTLRQDARISWRRRGREVRENGVRKQHFWKNTRLCTPYPIAETLMNRGKFKVIWCKTPDHRGKALHHPPIRAGRD